jgi:GDP-L-fucose synthase
MSTEHFDDKGGPIDKGARIYVAGHRGMVGSAIVRALKQRGLDDPIAFTSSELDLRDPTAVQRMMDRERPTHVYLAAAKVGGIKANADAPADFIFDNLMIETSVIRAAHLAGVSKLLFLGSSCIYPKVTAQPITEGQLMTGALEPTNAPYALAKIAGIELCKAHRKQHGANFISAMPTNLYGPGDNYHPTGSHVIPALIRKFHGAALSGAPAVDCWGSGTPRREFLHVDDLAEACLFLMDVYNGEEHVNVGTGVDMSILELAEMIAKLTGFSGEICWDSSQPDGTMRKQLDCSRIHGMGWHHQVELEAGLRAVIDDYAARPDEARSK